MVAAPINHICLDERGVAYIAGTRIKVRHIAIARNVWNQSPEEIQEGYSHLSLGQIHAALAYYYDHKEEVEAEIQRAHEEVEALRAQQSPPQSGRFHWEQSREIADNYNGSVTDELLRQRRVD